MNRKVELGILLVCIWGAGVVVGNNLPQMPVWVEIGLIGSILILVGGPNQGLK